LNINKKVVMEGVAVQGNEGGKEDESKTFS